MKVARPLYAMQCYGADGGCSGGPQPYRCFGNVKELLGCLT